MSSLLIPISLGVVVLFMIGLGYLVLRMTQSQHGAGQKVLSEALEGLQRTFLMHQKEFERSTDVKAATLRSELSQELQNNRRELQEGLRAAASGLEAKVGHMEKGIEERLKEMSQGVQSRLDQNVKEGFRHFEKVQEHLKDAEKQLVSLNAVGQSINDLNNLLKLPHLRGGFGEASLERLLSDWLPKGSFELQYQISPSSTERVDAVIKYPKFVLPIDSKFPREQVLALFETQEPAKIEMARKTLAEVMRSLGKQIKEKYIRPEHGTSEMALLFVPSETLYFEILRHDKILDELGKLKVFAVSPNTLAVTLQGISVARGYYEMAMGVEKTIGEVRKARLHFENFEKKFDDVGGALSRAQNAYHTATTHLTRYSSAVSRLTGADATREVTPVESSSEGLLLEPTQSS